MKNDFTKSILESVRGYYADTRNYISESLAEEDYSVVVNGDMLNDIMDQVQSGVFEQDGQYYKIPTSGNSTFCISPNGDTMIEDAGGNVHPAEIDDQAKARILNTLHPTEYVDELSESTDETDMYDTQADVKPDTANFAANGMGQIHENKDKNTDKMEKKTVSLNEAQLRNLIYNTAKQVIMESMGLDPETFEDEYEMDRDYLESPEGEGMEIDSIKTSNPVGDEEFYDYFLDNPAEESFGTTDDDFETNTEDSIDSLLDKKEEEDMQQNQDSLLKHIAESWNHHANSLIL